jgi:hypothetical protein
VDIFIIAKLDKKLINLPVGQEKVIKLKFGFVEWDQNTQKWAVFQVDFPFIYY